MKDITQFSADELELSAEIITHTMRKASVEFPYMMKPIYSLKTEPADEIPTVCADYHKFFYNPKWVIGIYQKNKKKLENTIIHSVLHCLLLHPSMTSEQDKLFDAAADMAVFSMMHCADAINAPSAILSEISSFLVGCNETTTSYLYERAVREIAFRTKMLSIVSKLKEDNHELWYKKPESSASSPESPDASANASNLNKEDMETEAEQVSLSELRLTLKNDENEWSALMIGAQHSAASKNFGSKAGNLFCKPTPPDRFSKFSYIEYLRRFAVSEVIAEDPDTLDMMMYHWGIDNLGNIPIIELCETRELCCATDIIIAIDVSGSCGGETAANFLRQLYSLFDQMNIKSSVNINVVTFDTQITMEKKIRSKKDADFLIQHYEPSGWGGTDFRCVFDYADNFSSRNRRKKLKGLFFFSDAFGAFPDTKPPYRTTFFVPIEESAPFFSYNYDNVPKWVELVKYKD